MSDASTHTMKVVQRARLKVLRATNQEIEYGVPRNINRADTR